MAITYLDEEQPKSKITYLDEESSVKLRLKPSGEFNKIDRIANYFMPQALSEQEYKPGEKNIFGDIQHALSRPGGAVRSAIMPKGRNSFEAAISGFQKPEEAPTFQEEIYKKYSPELTGNKAVDFAKAFPSAFTGTALDIATDPMTYAAGIIGKFLGKSAKAKGIVKAAGEEFGKAGKLAQATTQEILQSPIAETAKRGFVKAAENIIALGNKFPKAMNRDWLIKQSENTYNVADDTIKGIQEEYRYLYDDIGIGKMEVNKSELKEIIYNTMKGATKEEADDILNKLKTNLAPQSMGSYELSPNLDTVQKIKNLVQADIPENVWMKGKKGFDLTPAQSRKVNAYFRLKDVTRKTLAGTEEGEYLQYLDKKATNAYRLTKVIKRMVIDQTGQPSETGTLIKAFSSKAEQAGKENWFYQLKALNEDAQDIITNMNKFRKRQTIKKVVETTAGGYGVYEIGKRMLGK